MTETTLPQSKNWNDYWKLDQTKKFTKISWSKRRIIKILSKYVLEGKGVLDAGCGSGFFTEYFCKQKMMTVALDYSDKALEMVQQRTDGKAKVFKSDLVSSDLAVLIQDRFHLIFSDGLIEHFIKKDQDKIFHNFLSVLDEEGVLVTFVPNRWSPWELIRPFYMPDIDEKPFILKELIGLNERHGLKIIDRGGINTFPFAFSPDHLIGHAFGMLLYTVAKKK